MGLSGDIACLVRRQEKRQRSHFRRGSEPPDRLTADEIAPHRLERLARAFGHGRDPVIERWRLDGAGADRINAKALADEVGGGRLGEPDDRGFGRTVSIAVGYAADRKMCIRDRWRPVAPFWSRPAVRS